MVPLPQRVWIKPCRSRVRVTLLSALRFPCAAAGRGEAAVPQGSSGRKAPPVMTWAHEGLGMERDQQQILGEIVSASFAFESVHKKVFVHLKI